MNAGSPTSFGDKLRMLRKSRGLSQLDLALAAETTPRHLSFLETGRSRPGKAIVLRLAEALSLPLREKNAMLVAAGLSPAYSEHTFDAEALTAVRDIIDRVLQNHNPYPAFAFAPGLRILKANASAEQLFPGLSTLAPETLVEMWCTGQPEDPLEDRQRDAHQVVAMLRRELLHHPHPDLPELLERAENLAKALGPAPTSETIEEIVMCGKFRVGERVLKTIATVMRFDKAADITVADLRVELIFPADRETQTFFESRDAKGPDSP